ncbi:DUF3027 domain-containing protein [Rhodococcus indonesiensis]|uniref:DUF3027 domain-containing protein n=1 Tax=Rhodococcus indonesiensis TaxID=3055869 RepID=UPI0039F67B29
MGSVSGVPSSVASGSASASTEQLVQPRLADAVDVARAALLDAGETGVGAYLGVAAEDDCAATHRFAADLPGYRGWQWAVVVAAAPGSDRVTVSELALLPGPDALVAPRWVPWNERIRPGDLGPGDLLAPPAGDPRLVPGYVATGDPEIDETAGEIGLGRKQVMSLEGRLEAAQRWHDGDYGPESEMAKAAPSTCRLCGFYLPLAGSLRAAFGVCGNEFAADGHVVHSGYGCGAHSDTTLPTGAGSPVHEPYDDSAVEVVALPPAGEGAQAQARPGADDRDGVPVVVDREAAAENETAGTGTAENTGTAESTGTAAVEPPEQTD